MKKYYLEETSENIEQAENKYNFLPKEEKQHVYSLNKICLSKTIDIAKTRKNQLSTIELEENLKKYRDYAIKNHK